MPQTTQNFAVSPPPFARPGSVTSDALSDVLHAIHLRGGEVARVSSTGWSRHQHPSGARMVHIVEHGELRVELPGGKPTELDAGDMVLLARGDAHLVHAPAAAGWVSGEFLVENAVADPLLSVLPPAIVIRGKDEDTAWLPIGLTLMLAEMTEPGPGSRVMISRILDLLFIRTLRVWAASGQANPGWLTAAMDPALGRALSAIHQAPERNWSIDELARLAALSRSAFATRFSARLGEPPGAYLLHQRLGHAAHLLRSTTEPVGRVAATIGYASEAAFSRAFTREYGHSPRTWRTAQTRPSPAR
jgi:AraC-like DNA-binding protein/quercetin dioxygenase-like cupin family protein